VREPVPAPLADEPPAPAAAWPAYPDALPDLVTRFRDAGSLGVIVVDATALGAIERHYGREAHAQVGDALAHAVAEACAGQRGAGDRLARAGHGRDELALFFFRPRPQADFYSEGLGALAAAISEHLHKHGARLVYPYLRSAPRLSVGHAVALRNPVVSDERQLRNALREARSEAAQTAALDARERRRRLLQVLIREDVTMLFEPIASLSGREVLGYEALVRGPSGSDLQTPGAFFESAEEAGLLFEADSLCRRKALAAARGLPPGKRLFLNCLPSAIHDPDFRGAALRKTLERMHLRPSDVVFEISERESIGNFAVFREARDHFASLGLGVALDDMGVGYSSLQAVMELAPDFIKVDQSLVRGIDNDPPRQELLRALNAVAAKLGARLIAEGIETSEELASLQRLGIPLGQGYLLGRAAPLRRGAL
jgi:EAL domain-containing protein (putative c-di-GMP-specific phosphodiesterase class I)